MSVLLPVSTSSVTVLDIIKAAMGHLGVLDPAEEPAASDSDSFCRGLASLLDAWQLDPQAVIGREELTYIPSGATFTIGPGGNIDRRAPAGIVAAFYRRSGLDTPVGVKPLENYLSQASKTTQGTPDFIAYEHDGASGTVYVYPSGDGVSELHMWVLQDVVPDFQSITVTSTLSLPSGYRNALEWNLASELAADYPSNRTSFVEAKASRALKRLKRSNVRISELSMPDGVSTSGGFDINKG
jgi:hypothetical protein